MWVAQVVRKNNCNVDLAHNGKVGLELASSGVYDIVILDVMHIHAVRRGIQRGSVMEIAVNNRHPFLAYAGYLQQRVVSLSFRG